MSHTVLSLATPALTNPGGGFPVPIEGMNMAPLYIKEVTRKDGLLTTVSYDYDRESESVIEDTRAEFTSADVYTYFLLNKESSDWVLRIYPIANEENNPALAQQHRRAIFADMREFGTTIAYVTKDNSYTAISIRDNGTPRLWDEDKTGEAPDFRHINIGMSGKIAKRLSMLGTQTYLNMDATVVFVDEDDDTFYPHEEGVLYIKVTDKGGDEAIIKDGHYFIRPEVRDEMVKSVSEEMNAHNLEKARMLRRTLGKAMTFNGRLITGKGLIKGDAVVSHVLTTDIEVDRINIKDEVSTFDVHTGLFQMFPQEQMGKVFTNRQTISSFYKALMDIPTPNREGSINLIKDALKDYIDSLVDRFRTGELMLHIDSLGREKGDQIRNVFQKLEAWIDGGHSLNESLYLLMMEAGQIVDMLGCEPGSDDKKRRFPVPYATRNSIRNADTYRMVYGIELDLAYGEGFIDPELGLIVSDETYLAMIPVLGGADLDDHVEVHYRTAVDDDEFFDIDARDVVMVIIRNPIGIESDGEYVASEYWMLRAAAIERACIVEDLPELDPNDLPICTAELELSEPTFIGTDPVLTPNYSKQFFIEGVKASAVAQGVYGTHANLMMAFRLYNIPFPFLAPEETFVDVCQQTRHPEDLAYIRNLNEIHRKMLANADIPMDFWTKKRCGLRNVAREDGLFTELVNFHRDEVDRFEVKAKGHIHLVKQAMEARYDGVNITRMKDNKPLLLSRVEVMEARYRAENGKSSRLSYWDFEAIGNAVVDRLDELEATSASTQTRELTNQDFLEAHAWLFTQVQPSHRTTSVRSMYYNTDQKLMMGAMLDRLIEALLS